MCNGLILLALTASANIFCNIFCHLWPPIIFANGGVSAGYALMASSGTSVICFQYHLPHVVIASNDQGGSFPPISFAVLQLMSLLPAINDSFMFLLLIVDLLVEGSSLYDAREYFVW